MQRFWRAFARTHQLQAKGTIAWIDERLRRYRAYTGFRPWHFSSDGKPVRLHGHAHLTCGGIKRNDRKCVDWSERSFLRQSQDRKNNHQNTQNKHATLHKNDLPEMK